MSARAATRGDCRRHHCPVSNLSSSTPEGCAFTHKLAGRDCQHWVGPPGVGLADVEQGAVDLERRMHAARRCVAYAYAVTHGGAWHLPLPLSKLHLRPRRAQARQ